MSMKKDRIKVYEMTCTSCEKRVERSVNKIDGVTKIKANFSGQYAEIEYDDELCSISQIKTAIQNVGYSTENPKDFKFIGILVVVAAVALLGMNTSGFDMEAKLTNASYAVLFMVGVLTSIHCVGMCGGIMLSQSINKESKNKYDAIKPALLYNLGRVASYTLIGGIIGAIGSVFSMSLTAQAGLQIFAGIFMVMMGLNMAGFSAFRKFQIKIKLPMAFYKLQARPKTPFLVGFLNGFMPCGPLQTMQLFALGTGSAVAGALSMLMFALGTVPLMLTFGAISGLLSKGYTKKLLKFSGILVVVLGIIMSNRGLALAGMNMSPMALMGKIGAFGTENVDSANATKATIKDGVQYLDMTASYNGYTPDVLYIQKNMPVKWVVDGKDLTSCNSKIVIPTLNVEQKLQKGLNTIEFTPGDEDLDFSCWMGMISGTIKAVDDLETVKAAGSKSSSDDASAGSENATKQNAPSIYGADFSKVATDRFVKKMVVTASEQTITIKGIGYELEPLVMVAKKGLPAKLSLDLTAFDTPEGNFRIMNTTTKEIVAKFTGTKSTVEVAIDFSEKGAYGIYLEEELIGLIEAVDELDGVDLEGIRAKYIQ
jgi:sulfite exporter TauE/SafE/plastocyanin domain-containing protein/copper chaperone CopZ